MKFEIESGIEIPSKVKKVKPKTEFKSKDSTMRRIDTERVTYIYTLSDPVTKEVRYVGKTVNIKTRFNNHCSAKKKSHSASWILSLRPLKPELIVIEEVKENWIEREQFWINKYRTEGYRLTNLTDGGEGSLGLIHTEETINKISIAHKGVKREPQSEERKLAQSIIMTGRKATPETIAKLRIVKSNMSDETKALIGAAHKGKTISEEHKAISRAVHTGNKYNLGRKHTSEQNAAQSERQKGGKRTEETRARMGAWQVGRKIPPEQIAKFVETMRLKREAKLRGAS